MLYNLYASSSGLGEGEAVSKVSRARSHNPASACLSPSSSAPFCLARNTSTVSLVFTRCSAICRTAWSISWDLNSASVGGLRSSLLEPEPPASRFQALVIDPFTPSDDVFPELSNSRSYFTVTLSESSILPLAFLAWKETLSDPVTRVYACSFCAFLVNASDGRLVTVG